MSGFTFRGNPKQTEQGLNKPQKVLHQTASPPKQLNTPQTSTTLSLHPAHLGLLLTSQQPRENLQLEERANLRALKLMGGFTSIPSVIRLQRLPAGEQLCLLCLALTLAHGGSARVQELCLMDLAFSSPWKAAQLICDQDEKVKFAQNSCNIGSNLI